MMKKILFLTASLLILTGACKNKELSDDDICEPVKKQIKVVVNWDKASDARPMRMNLFSETPGIQDHDRDDITRDGVKYIDLYEDATYLPLCYDYHASNVYFRNETNRELFEAYCVGFSRATYESRADPVPGESTVGEPGEFHVHVWQNTFDVVFPDGTDELVLNFYPKSIMREFTYRINKVTGANYINEARGAISGMSASYILLQRALSDKRSTVLFENCVVGGGDTGYIEGKFYTFGPVQPYSNRFTMELLSKSNKYFSTHWDVSEQITESMENREAKIARDGYDILLDMDPSIVIDPPGEGGGGGFDIGVGEWDDNVIIYL